jgi:hypothetical protein
MSYPYRKHSINRETATILDKKSRLPVSKGSFSTEKWIFTLNSSSYFFMKSTMASGR